jgi:hypothetical protein
MAVRIVIAIAARIIPTAVAGFGANGVPLSWLQVCRILWGINLEEMCELLHTSAVCAMSRDRWSQGKKSGVGWMSGWAAYS